MSRIGMPFGSKGFSPLAVSLSAHEVRVIQLRGTDQGSRLHDCVAVPLDGRLERAEALEKALGACLSRGRFQGKKALLCIEGRSLFTHHQRQSREDLATMERRVREEFHRNIPFDAERAEVRFLFDREPRDPGPGRQPEDYILFLADPEAVTEGIACLEARGLKPLALGAEPLGALSAFRAAAPGGSDAPRIRGLLVMGRERADLLVIRDGRLVLTRSLPMGGELLEGALERRLEIARESAESLKRALCRGERINEDLRAAARSAFRPVLESLASEILSCHRYFASIANRESVQDLTLVGEEAGGVLDPEFLGRRLGVPVRTWKPGADFDAGAACSERSPASDLPLLGMASDHLSGNEPEVDFIPRSVRERRIRRRVLSFRVSTAAILLAAMTAIFLFMRQRTVRLEKMRSLAEARCELIDMKRGAVDALKDERGTLEDRRTLILNVRPRIRPSRLLAELALHARGDVTLTEVRVDRATNVKSDSRAEKDPGGEAEAFVLKVKGLAVTATGVTRFLDRLSASGLFRTLRDEGFEDVMSESMKLKRFSLVVTVEEGAHETL